MPPTTPTETPLPTTAWNHFLHFLHTPLWHGDGFTLTPATLLVALALLAFGALLASSLSRLAEKHLPKRIRENPQAVSWTRRLIFTAICLLFIFWTLDYLSIPLTTFAFLGGALALGFGFGAQTLCNNLIAGVILLFEHPYRPGDTLEIDSQAGVVRQIGLRATEIRLFDGATLLVPNSYFLSTIIRNRTSGGAILRGSLTLSVDYNTDTRRLERLLLEITTADPRILQTPRYPPSVLFSDFADSALLFTLRFWVNTRRASLPLVASDLRHAILTRTRAENITIPYPQLDLHFPTQPPPSPKKKETPA